MANSNTPGHIVQKAPINIGGSTPPVLQSDVGGFVQQQPFFITKFQFRKLFTLTERMAVDNAQYNSKFSTQVKAAIVTMQKDLEVSGEVDLHLKDVFDGVHFLVTCGILTHARADRILANLPPQ